MSTTYSIGTLAKAGGVGVETIRYYERRKLLNQPGRRHGSMRRYGQSDLETLRFIRRAQAAGFSLDEVEALTRFHREKSCRSTRTLASRKLREIETRLVELKRLRDQLRQWVAECDANQHDDCCPVLDQLSARAGL